MVAETSFPPIMKPIHLSPTDSDIAIAHAIKRHATPSREQALRVLTWLADERVLYAASLAIWFASRRGGRRQRRQADHVILSAVLASIVPHLLKHAVDQKRPDREIDPPRRGIPRSGRAEDAFPSGHAMHIGAVASAITWIKPKAGPWVWPAGLLLAGTRVLLLAHWTSDVVVGLLVGAGLERALRPSMASASRRGRARKCRHVRR
jgi:undecaprenyl-diphosphatase